MQNSLTIYFIKRIVLYAGMFVRDYFHGGFNFFFHLYERSFMRVGKKLGFFANWRYFKVPLWREYSLPAYLLSIPIRVIKLLSGGIILLFVTAVFAVLAFCWFIIPFYLIGKIFYF